MEVSSTPSADDGSHLDGIQMPDLDADYVDADAPIEIGADGAPLGLEPEMISREAFWVVFETAFSMPGMFVPDLKPLGISEEEKAGARAASDATYSLLEIYYPAALMPQSETLANLLIAGPFFIGKALVIREIMRAKMAKPVERKPAAASPETKGPESGTATSDPLAFMDAEKAAA